MLILLGHQNPVLGYPFKRTLHREEESPRYHIKGHQRAETGNETQNKVQILAQSWNRITNHLQSRTVTHNEEGKLVITLKDQKTQVEVIHYL